MNWFFVHYLDILTLLIVLGGISYGYKKGIVRMVIFIAGFVIAAFAAGFVSSVCGEYVYMSFIKPAVTSALEENIRKAAEEYDPQEMLKDILKENSLDSGQEEPLSGERTAAESEEAYSLLTGEEFCGTLNSVFAEYCEKISGKLSGVLPGEIRKSAEEYLEKSGADAKEKLEIISGGGKAAAEFIEENVIRPVMIASVKRVIFLVVFALVTAVFALISKTFGIIRRIELIKAPDSFLGGVLGFLMSLLTAAALSLICGIYINISSDGGKFLNSAVISATYIFKYAYAGTFMIISILLK